jgi:hypothetical protein
MGANGRYQVIPLKSKVSAGIGLQFVVANHPCDRRADRSANFGLAY